VVGGGVAARVPAPQHRGEELTGVVTERQHRVIAEGALRIEPGTAGLGRDTPTLCR
jgi:hypothetical protein